MPGSQFASYSCILTRCPQQHTQTCNRAHPQPDDPFQSVVYIQQKASRVATTTKSFYQ
jgi:hypothetical protein